MITGSDITKVQLIRTSPSECVAKSYQELFCVTQMLSYFAMSLSKIQTNIPQKRQLESANIPSISRNYHSNASMVRVMTSALIFMEHWQSNGDLVGTIEHVSPREDFTHGFCVTFYELQN